MTCVTGREPPEVFALQTMCVVRGLRVPYWAVRHAEGWNAENRDLACLGTGRTLEEARRSFAEQVSQMMAAVLSEDARDLSRDGQILAAKLRGLPRAR